MRGKRHIGFLLFPPSLLPVYSIFLPHDSERTLEPARLKGAHKGQGPCLASGWKRSDVPSAPQLHTSLCTGPGQHWSPVLSPRCTEVSVLATGRSICLAADIGSSILCPLCACFSEQEGKSKWRGKTSIHGTARRKKRAFRLAERFDLSVVASRNLKQMCCAGICCR